MSDFNVRRLSRRAMIKRSGVAAAALGLLGTTGFSLPPVAQASGQKTEREANAKPTIVLVHGAWADGSSWSAVIRRLQDSGYTVVAPAVGLLSLSGDIAAVRTFISNLQTPTLVVGHSYGGAVMTGAASGLSNVKGLVYIAGFAPDTNESLLTLATQFDQQYGSVPAAQFYRPDGPFDANHPQTLIYLDRANYGSVFVQDIDPDRAAILAAVQRPISVASFAEPLAVEPAWKQFRTWYQVSREDRAISPDGERFMAKRMSAETIEIVSSHASLVSHPLEIAQLIKRAAQAVG